MRRSRASPSPIEPPLLPARPPLPPPTIRPLRAGDAAACATVWERSIADYERRLARPAISPDHAPVVRLIDHLRETDPERCWVATRPWAAALDAAGRAGADLPPRVADPGSGLPGDEAIVGFAAASIRGGTWFLGLLFVLPGEQGRGLGTKLLAATFPDGRLPRPGAAAAPSPRGETTAPAAIPAILATVIDSVQPISNGLYARIGVVPRLPAFRLVGRPRRPGALGALPRGIRAATDPGLARGAGPLEAAIGELDATLLGSARPADHAFLRRDGRRRRLYRDGRGRLVGYGYVTAAGRLGPVAVADADLLVPVVGDLLDAIVPAGPSAVPATGANPELFAALLAAGFRIDGFPALICWNRPFGSLERYLLGSYALP
ncbi:MAG: hypothetical protein RL338_1188 [Chloroflexota bacterium]